MHLKQLLGLAGHIALKSHSLGVSLTPGRHISRLNFCKVCISSMESHSWGAQLIIHTSTHFILYLRWISLLVLARPWELWGQTLRRARLAASQIPSNGCMLSNGQGCLLNSSPIKQLLRCLQRPTIESREASDLSCSYLTLNAGWCTKQQNEWIYSQRHLKFIIFPISISLSHIHTIFKVYASMYRTS